MKNKINNTKIINIEDEIKKSYINYAMSVIIGRALPDVRDGLKPVHRRILYAMYILKNRYNKQYKKSARIVGDVIGKYHPHGDNAVYDSIVRMVQKFSLRYPLIDGQGNFGSIDGDSAAAMRYTEIKMSKITEKFIIDIEKKTINFIPNYDNSEKIPEILPTQIPNILINGSTGIAVGMATNIPPHNITEVMNAFIAFIDNKKINTISLMKYIKGPDFPTGGIIEKSKEIYRAYKTGRGTIKIKAKIKINKKLKNNKENIIIHELPYQVNKTKLIEKIVELIKEKKIEGINNIKDESNKEGMRIVIEIKKKFKSKILINKLLYLTNLEISYGINIVALHKNKPQILNLKKIIKIFIKHRKKIIIKKTYFKIKKITKKIHILEGLFIAFNNIDYIINIIKNSNSINKLKKKLSNIKWNTIKIKKYIFNKIDNEYILTDKQIISIININLYKLTNLEKQNIIIKYKNNLKKIKNLKKILNDKKFLENIIKEEFINIKNKFGDKRLTTINKLTKKIKEKDLIKKERIIIIITKLGNITYQKISLYKIQHRGRKGKLIFKTKQNDRINRILLTNTHNNIFFFSNKGKIFSLIAYKLPNNENFPKGKKIKNILKLNKNEKINKMLSFNKETLLNKKNILILTKNGIIKKIKIKKIKKITHKGTSILNLKNKDKLIEANFTTDNNKIMLFTKLGKTIKFSEKNIRNTGKKSFGIKGINLLKDDKIRSLVILNKNEKILITTENGYGKITSLKEFPTKSRATKGIISIKINNKNGFLLKAIKIKKKNKQIFIITNVGNLIRIPISEINILKRNTQGVILIKLKNKEKVKDIQKI